MEQYRDYVRRIMIAVNAIDGLYYLSARKTGIKVNTLSLLYALSDGKSYSQKQICEEWLIPKTTINTVVKECIEEGYIRLHVMKHSREKIICLTDSGKEYADRILSSTFSVEGRAMKKTLEEFSPESVRMIERFAAHLHTEFLMLSSEDEK